jgi:hypothetical protein
MRQERPLPVLGEGGNQREVRLRRLAEDDDRARFRSVPRDDRPALPSRRAIVTGISTTVIAGVSSAAVKVGVRTD